MKIYYRTRKLANIMSVEREIFKAYGEARGKAIMRRMAVLNAADCLADVPTEPPTRRHELRLNRKGQFAVDVTGNYRLTFEPINDPLPSLKDGGIDLRAITEIRILRVEDYHGN